MRRIGQYIGIAIIFLLAGGRSGLAQKAPDPVAQAPSHIQVQFKGPDDIQVQVSKPGQPPIQTPAPPPAGARKAPSPVPSPVPAPPPAPAPAPPRFFSTSWKIFRLSAQEAAQAKVDADILAVFLLTPDPGWYAYSGQPGAAGKPTRLAVRQNPGGNSLAVYYPPGDPRKDLFEADKTIQAYAGTTPLFVPLRLPPEGGFGLSARLRMLLCSDTRCLPVDAESLFLGTGLDLKQLPHPTGEAWWPLFVSLAAAGPLVPADAPGARTPGPGQPAAPAGQAAPVAAAPPATPPAPPAAATAQAGDSGLSKAGQALREALAEAGPEKDFQAPASWSFSPRYFRPHLEVSTLIPAILFGLLAGFLLNFMPCVLPVVCLKLSAIMVAPREGECQGCPPTETLFREHNLFFAMGVLVYFLILSLVLGYTGLAWGQIFQKSGLVLGLVVLVFALSLSLFGLYTLPMVDLKKISGQGGNPRFQAFFTGLLATLLATPCSGPFLGGVLSWALLQPSYVVSSVFMSIGLGMALPYIVMTYFPGLFRFFPKPGAWTMYMEKAVAFFLLGTCIYLMNILPRDMLVPTLIALWLTGLWAWIWGLSARFDSRINMAAARTVALAVLAAGIILAVQPRRTQAQWEPFEPVRFSSLLGRERILVDFTADWCPTCKVLEQTVLTAENLAAWKKRYGLVFLRADLTEDDPAAMELLRILGSRSIPVAAIFEKGEAAASPLVIRDLFTVGQLEEALGRN